MFLALKGKLITLTIITLHCPENKYGGMWKRVIKQMLITSPPRGGTFQPVKMPLEWICAVMLLGFSNREASDFLFFFKVIWKDMTYSTHAGASESGVCLAQPEDGDVGLKSKTKSGREMFSISTWTYFSFSGICTWTCLGLEHRSC